MTTSNLLRGALLACGLLLAAGCSAHNDATPTTTSAAVAPSASATTTSTQAASPVPASSTDFTEGNQYADITSPKGQAAPTGPIELVEVFSYACPHCAEFAPYMDKLRAELPKGVTVRYMPAVFSPAWMPSAQAFYAARQLGVLDQTHDAMFKAHLEHYPLNSLQDMAAWYGKHGVDSDKFLAAATNATTTREMAKDQRTEMGWGIDATPTLVVGRRASDAKDAPFVALMRSANVTSYGQLQQLGLWMVKHAEE